MLRILFRISKI